MGAAPRGQWPESQDKRHLVKGTELASPQGLWSGGGGQSLSSSSSRLRWELMRAVPKGPPSPLSTLSPPRTVTVLCGVAQVSEALGFPPTAACPARSPQTPPTLQEDACLGAPHPRPRVPPSNTSPARPPGSLCLGSRL